MKKSNTKNKVYDFLTNGELKITEKILREAATTHFPTPMSHFSPSMTDDEKIKYIEEKFRDIMWALGLDLSNDSLVRTPERVATMFVKEIFSGLKPENFPAISVFRDSVQYRHSNLVAVKTYFHSFCEHHFIPMDGEAYVAYVPNGKWIGLSKIPRIVRYFARRPQVQERLNAQIADSLAILLETENVAVSLVLEHTCVAARGIGDTQSHTITNVLRGEFETNEMLRREFFEAINRREAN